MMKKTMFFAMSALWASCLFANCKVESPWIRETRGKTAAVFMEIHNLGGDNISLLTADSSACEHTELHENIQEGAVLKMRPVTGMTINANSSIRLEPSGKHIMLIGLRQPLKAGDKVPIKLFYSDKSMQEVLAEVKPINYSRQSHTCTCKHDQKKD